MSGRYEVIVAPTDGSDRARRAAERAIDLASRYDAALHFLYVVDTHTYGEPALSSGELLLDDMEAKGEAVVRELATAAADAGVEATCRVCHGTPSSEIVDYAEGVDADLLVLGARGRTQGGTGHLGGVTNRVVHRANGAVLVV